ncbi:MAG TPA: type II toxin-antitoxin system HipA family toxin, partial [Sedimenticola sp.]|nr:type II toxin-antitoxin system HipA family toxin [Sedimenticola sp.]
MADVSVLSVSLYGDPIGTLTLLPGDQTLFSFDQAYIDNPGRPTLSLSFKDSLGDLITDIRPTRTRVPPFFSNLLPEGHMRDYLAKKAGVSSKREFYLLWVLGRDLPGAITVTPAEGEPWPPQIAGEGGAEETARAHALRFSLAGIQLKFSAMQAETGGLTIPAEGVGGSWIVKLPSMKFEGVPENEFAMMELARAIGIDVPELRLVPLQDIAGLPDDMARLEGNALAVKRFDRLDSGGAVHIEDFAQVFGLYPEKKYERASYRNIAEVLWAETGEEGIAEFIRRLVFNVLVGNADMHLKNWSLIYPDRKTTALSPGYDFVSTIAHLADDKMALTLGRSKKMADLSLDQLAYLAAKARLPEKLVLDTARETAERFMTAWDGGRF